jgi:hypothetical protein
MDTLDILERLTTALQVDVRVCPLNQIPHPVYPAAYVINFDTANLPGTHWGLVCLHSDRSVTFFDPLCIEPVPELLHHWFSSYIPVPVAMNCQAAQHPLSITCGAHVIFVGEKHFLFHLPIERILSQCYTRNLLENDAMVRQYCLQIKKL